MAVGSFLFLQEQIKDIIISFSLFSNIPGYDKEHEEKELLDTLLHVCGIKKQSSSNVKDDVINELKNKFKLAEGQLRVGNNFQR